MRAALTRALTAACVVLLCVFGTGPDAATAADPRPSSSAPAEPAEGPSDPAADAEARAAVRTVPHGEAGVRRTPLPWFHVKHPDRPAGAAAAGRAEPASCPRTVRSAVLRC
ncbi:hypothetical protein AMK16_18625 [Streptomyces sp. CB00455]|nr:hypothetical protein AMK16_18625 [Streptomyces sp. CB00455]